ncbi:hypothetical protein FOFC_20358, partial [Fusarium oxysporum]
IHLAISGHPIDLHACKHYNIDDEDYNANTEAVSASLFLHDRMNLQKCLLTSSRGCARSTIPHTLPTRSTKRNHQKRHNQRIESDSAATVQPAPIIDQSPNLMRILLNTQHHLQTLQHPPKQLPKWHQKETKDYQRRSAQPESKRCTIRR